MTTATKERSRARKGGANGTALAVADLKRALAAVAQAVPSRSPKPVLSNVLLSREMVSGTDLELRIDAPLDCYDGPAMLLPFSRLNAIVKELPDSDVVTLTKDGSSCVVSGSRVEYRLPTEDPNEFPVATEVKAKSIARLPGSQFVSLMQSVKFAADTESSRYALGGVLIQLDRPKDKESSYSDLSFVGTDGRRLCLASCQVCEDTDECRVLVPKATVDVLCSLAEKDHTVHLSHSGNELIATVTQQDDDSRGIVVRSLLLQGRFPTWQDTFPERTVKPSSILVGELLHACRQAAICSSEQSKGVLFSITADGLHLSSRSSEYGEASVEVGMMEVGHNCSVKLDPRFLVEWLGCKSFDVLEPIELEAESAVTAVVLKSGDCRCVVMPLAAE